MNVRWFEELTVAGVAEAATRRQDAESAAGTIHARPPAAEARRSSSRPDADIVTFPHEGTDQRDEAVSRTTRTTSTRCRPDA